MKAQEEKGGSHRHGREGEMKQKEVYLLDKESEEEKEKTREKEKKEEKEMQKRKQNKIRRVMKHLLE